MADERLSTTVRDVEAEKFITAYAAHMKRSNKVTPPEWQDMVKTATWKEKGPLKGDWYYTRAAAVARKIYLRPRGIGQLQQAFGGRARRGTRRNKSAKGTQGIIRHCLQQLEKAGIVHAGVGKASFSEEQITGNVQAFLNAVQKARPTGAKGTFIKRIALSSSMGPGVKIDVSAAADG